MSDDPYETGFLEEIKAVNFGGGAFLLVYTTIGLVFDNQGGSNSATLAAYSLAGAPFTIPGIGVLAPSAAANFTRNGDGSGDMVFSVGPFSRLGMPSGAFIPITDTITSAMRSAFVAWQGQFITTQQLHQPAIGPGTCFLNVDGYLVINLAKVKSNLSFSVTAPTQTHSGLVAAASYKNALVKTVLLTSASGDDADKLSVTTSKKQTDLFPNFSSPSTKPANAIGYGKATTGGSLPTNVAITCDIKTLAVTVH